LIKLVLSARKHPGGGRELTFFQESDGFISCSLAFNGEADGSGGVRVLLGTLGLDLIEVLHGLGVLFDGAFDSVGLNNICVVRFLGFALSEALPNSDAGVSILLAQIGDKIVGLSIGDVFGGREGDLLSEGAYGRIATPGLALGRNADSVFVGFDKFACCHFASVGEALDGDFGNETFSIFGRIGELLVDTLAVCGHVFSFFDNFGVFGGGVLCIGGLIISGGDVGSE